MAVTVAETDTHMGSETYVEPAVAGRMGSSAELVAAAGRKDCLAVAAAVGFAAAGRMG